MRWYRRSCDTVRKAVVTVGLIGAAVTLQACAIDPQSLLTTPAQLQQRTPFTAVAPQQAWINAPGVVMVMQRGLRGESEQRVALDNRTTVPGENLLILRAQDLGGRAARLNFEALLRRIGGAPAPFATVRAGDLTADEDEIGPYFWTEQRFGDDVVCVLGLRRVTSSQRLLPGNATVMDIVLRNCVQGSAQDALAPLFSGSITAPPVTGAVLGETRVLSPLAAPMVR
ncbi:hypothetical protein PANO111632_14675 [Paracoccus nototheniae]|uniref:Cellulose biosynthesis protein BcsN n=1 Tax=Paracoccus nototheniae TaxID=2489002 RepID=A0ABW4E3U8_9RHOB|nr:hypothetical protein [Paracoccus nototheniae]